MNKASSLNYDRVVKALQHDGWMVVKQKDSGQKILFGMRLKEKAGEVNGCGNSTWDCR